MWFNDHGGPHFHAYYGRLIAKFRIVDGALLDGRLPSRVAEYFRKVRVKNGSVAWPNGYDVCPEVLRFWCLGGHATTQAETDAHFRAEGKIAA